jgi:hypothetical protein
MKFLKKKAITMPTLYEGYNMKTTEKSLNVKVNTELSQKIKKALKEHPIGQEKMARAKKLFDKGIPDWDALS